MRSRVIRIAASILLCLALLVPGIRAAHANPLSDGWQCAKKAGMTSAVIGKDLYKKGEALASDAGAIAACLARTGPEAQALMATSSALTALRLAKPSLLPKGQCESRIKGVATKPFANGLAALLPSGNAKDQLISAAASDTANGMVWDQIAQLPPPFSSVPSQIECGCLLSDNALSLTDVSEITNAVASTSESCAAMLDSLGLGFINDIGSYASKLATNLAYGLSDKWDEVIGGQSDPGPPGLVFESFYGRNLDSIAINMAKYPTGWQGQAYDNKKGWNCNYNMNSGQWEGQCSPSFGQIYDLCVDYYDSHKMSKGNAQKVCAGYRDTVVSAATVKSKQLAAIAQLPSLIELVIQPWLKSEWLWRMPKTYTPGTYTYENGNNSGWALSDPQAGSLRNEWSAIVGSQFTNPGTASPGENYPATGILAIARGMVLELGNDPQKASALAFASVTEPLRDKVRKAWADNRAGVARYELRGWYPTPTFGYRYGCPTNLHEACGDALEARFDKLCFTPISELYVTGRPGPGFIPRYSQTASKCREQLAPILAAAQKLDTAEASAVASLCPATGTRDEHAMCLENQSKAYRACAAKALKDGNDDAGPCLAAKQLGKNILDQLKKGAQQPGTVPPPQNPRSSPKP